MPEETRKHREEVSTKIIMQMQALLTELQGAGELPAELVQRVTMERLNNQFGMMGNMMKEAAEMEAKKEEPKS